MTNNISTQLGQHNFARCSVPYFFAKEALAIKSSLLTEVDYSQCSCCGEYRRTIIKRQLFTGQISSTIVYTKAGFFEKIGWGARWSSIASLICSKY